jgi:hypothetical protein
MGDASQKYCRTFERHGIAKLELVPAAAEKSPDRLLNAHEVADMLGVEGLMGEKPLHTRRALRRPSQADSAETREVETAKHSIEKAADIRWPFLDSIPHWTGFETTVACKTLINLVGSEGLELSPKQQEINRY